MAADSTRNDTEGSPDETRNEPPSLLAAHLPLPPRPTKRAGRSRASTPTSAPRSRVSEEAASADSFDSAPASPLYADGDEPVDDVEFPLVSSRAKPSSARPEESFEDLGADLADRAPSAPVTPWRDVPALPRQPPEVTASPAVAIDEDDERQADHEATMVGQVPRNLLELSSSGDENTRAYTAPQELIELAKRKREERLNAKVAPEAHSKETERPPAQQRRAAAAKSAKPSEVPAPLTRRADPAAAPSWPEEDSAPAVAKSDQPSEVAAALARRAAPAAAPSRPEEDSAPAVLRTNSGEMEAVRSSERAPPSAAPSVAGEALDFDEPPSEPASVEPAPAVRARADMSPASVALSLSSYKTPWLTAPRRWALLVALFVLVGLVLSRWRAIEALLLR